MKIPGNLMEVSRMKTLLLFAVLGLFYGGVHATSWNGHFPSLVERALWRVSVCVVAGGGFVVSGLFLLFDRFDDWLILRQEKGFKLKTIFRSCICTVLGAAGWVLILGLSISRIYIVVEAFISIRSLPLGSYSTVRWVNFLPHIG